MHAISKSRSLNLEVGYYGNELSISGFLTYFGKMGFVSKKSLQNTLTKIHIYKIALNHFLKTRSRVAILYLSTSISGTINCSKHFDYIDNLHERA